MLTSSRLKELLEYDPETGRFSRRTPCGHFAAGTEAGYVHRDGRVRVKIDRRSYLGHRLAWLYVHGEWPKRVIDHINGIPTDNRIANLRDVSMAVNSQNRRTAKPGSRTGVLGVMKRRAKFLAKITLNGVSHDIGLFETPDEAHQAYLAAKRRMHEGCTL